MIAERAAGERQSARFWGRMAARYSRSPIRDLEAYERKLDMTRALLRPDMHVLEFGCGTGSTALRHAPHVGKLHAIDVSAKMIEIARGKVDAGSIGNVRFEQATLDTLPVDAGPYDVAFGFSILHLVVDVDDTLNQVYRRLETDGRFVTSTPCLTDTHLYLRPLLPALRLVGLAPRVTFFSRERLEGAFERAGFEMEQAWQPDERSAVFHVMRKAVHDGAV